MSEPKQFSPMLDGFIMGECISDHNGVRCYPAIRENTDERYIVKIISIPASQVQLDALLLAGACKDTLSAQSYFMELAAGAAEEAELLTRLSKLEGFVPYLDVQIEAMDEGTGYEVCLLSPYRRSLERQMHVQPLTHLAAVNLGLDLCAALAACRRAGQLYVDLKPNNIFVTENQEYRIGDLGFIPLDSLKFASLPEKYRSSYTAPEIRDAMATLNDTLDIYALGLVLYQIYNNGELPFEGESPEVKLPPPTYADYEMAEIILKACSPNIWERWQDPAQMGQALVNYMQRNGVNDTPIVPPPVPIQPEEPPEEDTEDFLSEDENEAALAPMLEQLPEEDPMELPAEEASQSPEEPEDPENAPDTPEPEEPAQEDELSFMEELSSDETAPSEESVQELQDAPVTEEVSEMLAQADELIAHELPEPAVAPDPIDIPIPPPILPQEPEEVIPEEPEAEPEEDENTSEEEPENSENSEEDDVFEETEEFLDEEPEFTEDEDVPQNKPRRKAPWIVAAIAAVLVAVLGLGGYRYYHSVYLQTIDSLQVIGSENQITVFLSADIDETLLSVRCTDTYGNTRQSPVVSGISRFEQLDPGTQYKIEVEISGSHKLLGTTTGSYTTAAQTQIVNLSAAVGPEDGSVVLNFSVVGPDSEQWSVAYAPVGTTEKIQDFTGHSVTITGLTPNTEYNFRLICPEELYLTGSDEIRFTPQDILYAQNLTITAYSGGSLTAQWENPENAEKQIWVIHCFNEEGFDETVTTEDTTVTFDGLDPASGYTIKVTAQGMSQSATAAVTANPITVTGFTHTFSSAYEMTLDWTFTGNAPAAGWQLSYQINGGEAQSMDCAENQAVVTVYPGDHVTFTLKCLDSVTYFPLDGSVDVPAYESFAGFSLTAEDLTFSMCSPPDKENWGRSDLEDSDYKTTFSPGETAAFLIKRPKNSESSQKKVTVTYVIRDESGKVVSNQQAKFVWDDLWVKRYCALELPELPETAGNYTIDLCFNGMLAVSQSFIVVS